MSFDDVSPNEMRELRGVTSQDIDRLLSGRLPAAGVEMDDLTSFFSDLGGAFPKPPVETLEAKHVTAMMRAVGEAVVSEPISLSTTEASQSRTLRYVFSMKRKIAAASAAGLTAFSGLAVAGVLPPSVQRGVANAVGHVGIGLPGATADEVSRPAERQPLERSSQQIAEPLENNGRSHRPDADGAQGSGGDPEWERGSGPAAANDEEAADEARDREEDAADEAQDAQEEAADEARDDREEDAPDEAQDAQEEAANEARDREEDAADDADDAQDAQEEAAGDRADHAEDAADDASESEEEVESSD